MDEAENPVPSVLIHRLLSSSDVLTIISGFFVFSDLCEDALKWDCEMGMSKKTNCLYKSN